MTKLSPFLSTPEQWVEKLARLKKERAKIEGAEKHLHEKLMEHMSAKGLISIPAGDHEARLVRRVSTDFSRATLTAYAGAEWMAKANEDLPKRESVSLVIGRRKEKAEEDDTEGVALKREVGNFFDTSPEKKKSKSKRRKSS